MTALPVEAATQEVTRVFCQSKARTGANNLQKDRAHTFRDREIHEYTGYGLYPMLEDCNDCARREHAEKCISIKEFGARP